MTIEYRDDRDGAVDGETNRVADDPSFRADTAVWCVCGRPAVMLAEACLPFNMDIVYWAARNATDASLEG